MLGLSLIDTKPEEAKPLFGRAAELGWNEAGLLLQAAQGMAYVGEWAEAARVSDRAQDIASADFASQDALEHLRGRILLELDRPQEALPPLRSVYDRDPSIDGGTALADVYVQLERYRLAQDVIVAGLEHLPTEPRLLQLRAWLMDEGLWAEDSDG
jgi:tetratricopeptide (TPR) repeat protein